MANSGEMSRTVRLSGISEMINYCPDPSKLEPLWVGEGDLSTPRFICDAASEAMYGGETFYTWQRGAPWLREALRDYISDRYAVSSDIERFTVTGSGMQAVQMAICLTVSAEKYLLVPTPAWPNFEGSSSAMGAKTKRLKMRRASGRWYIDADELRSQLDGSVSAVFINTPGNPTGYAASRDELREILNIARAAGVWIIADEVYNHFHFGSQRPASFHDVAEDDDKIIYCNTFSKNWAMTGWRMGWIETRADMGDKLEALVQFSTSGVPQFLQRGAYAALTSGQDFLASEVERARHGRELVGQILASHDAVEGELPTASFYYYFRLPGTVSADLAKNMVSEINVGIAPGSAFGEPDSDWYRLCFLRSPDRLRPALEKISEWLSNR